MLANYSDDRSNKLRNFYGEQEMELESQYGLTKPLSRLQLANDYEKKLLSWMVEAHRVLTGNVIDLNKFKDLMSVMEHMRVESERDYYKALVSPEKMKGAKIPSPIPIPSASFQLKQSIWLSTNATGNLAVAFNPWGLFTTDRSTLYINNHSSLTGTGPNVNWAATRIGQQLPQAIYNRYRVVSSSVAVRYVGRYDIVQGIIGGSIAFETVTEGDPTTTTVAVGHPLEKYGDFNLAMDAFYTQENLTLHGARGIYFPVDNSYENYTSLGTSKGGFMNLFYISGGVSASQSYKLDICVNLECIPESQFLNYMPVSCSSRDYDAPRIQEAIKTAQKSPITKAEDLSTPYGVDADSPKGGVMSTIGDIVSSVGTIIPGIKTLAGIVGSFL